MTLNPTSESNAAGAPELPTKAPGPEESPPANKSRRRRPQGLFSGDPSDDQPRDVSSPSPSPDHPPAEGASASESSDAGDKPKRRRRGPAASSVSLTDRRQLKAAIGAGVGLVGMQLHESAAARDEMAAAEGLWLADEQDQEGISEPLSSLVARRGGPGVVNPDLGDAIAAVIALAVYVSKNLAIRARIRAFRKGQPTDQGAAMTEQPQEPAA